MTRQEKQRKVEKHFYNGGELSVKRCLSLFGTTELRRIVSRLRKRGMNIKDRWTSLGYKIYFYSQV